MTTVQIHWRTLKEGKPEIQVGSGYAPVLFNVPSNNKRHTVCAGRYFLNAYNLPVFVSLQGSTFYEEEVSHWADLPEAPRTKKRRRPHE